MSWKHGSEPEDPVGPHRTSLTRRGSEILRVDLWVLGSPLSEGLESQTEPHLADSVILVMKSGNIRTFLPGIVKRFWMGWRRKPTSIQLLLRQGSVKYPKRRQAVAAPALAGGQERRWSCRRFAGHRSLPVPSPSSVASFGREQVFGPQSGSKTGPFHL